MSKINLRNAGFELGTLAWWTELEGNDFTLDSVNHHWGAHCGYVLSVDDGDPTLIHNDYIEAIHGEVYEIRVWHKFNVADDLEITVVEYDDNLNEIGSVKIHDEDGSDVWTGVTTYYGVSPDVRYFRVKFEHQFAETGDWMLLDDLSIRRVDNTEKDAMVRVISDDTVRTDTFDTDNNLVNLLGYNKYFIELEYDYLTGTVTSIDIDVFEMRGMWARGALIGSFTTVTTSDVRERISLPLAVGKGVYVDVTVVKVGAVTFKSIINLIGMQ